MHVCNIDRLVDYAGMFDSLLNHHTGTASEVVQHPL